LVKFRSQPGGIPYNPATPEAKIRGSWFKTSPTLAKKKSDPISRNKLDVVLQCLKSTTWEVGRLQPKVGPGIIRRPYVKNKLKG
jgi:hypothetical protein